MKKLAFVLSGGGAKGGYEIGFLKAINELSIHPDIVTGTSIGALNGCLIAQQDDQIAYDLWKNLTVDQVVIDGFSTDFSIDSLVSNTNLLLPFFKSYLNYKGANITPLIQMIHRLSNQKKLMDSPIDFGLVTVEYPSLKPIEITKKEIKEGLLADYLIASASCFPAFPIHYINKQGYIDGGYYDNLPIDLAIKMGATEIIAVELNHHNYTHEEYMDRPNIKIISPSQDNGGFLDFDEKLRDKRMTLGYYDTLKAYGKYLGEKYIIEPSLDEQFIYDFYQSILLYEAKIVRDSIKSRIKIFEPKPLTSCLLNQTTKKELSLQDYTIIALEILADYYAIDSLTPYSFTTLSNLLFSKFEADLQSCMNLLYIKNYSMAKLTQFLNELKPTQLIAFLYLKIEDGTFQNSNWLLPMFSKECLCAIFLHHYKQTQSISIIL